MKNTYVVQFTKLDGIRYEYEFVTDNIDKAILEYCQNKEIKEHKIISEGAATTKRMLLG